MKTWWEHVADPLAKEQYPTLAHYLKGSFKDAEAPAFIYVAEVNSHPEFIKIGFSKVEAEQWVASEGHYGAFLYKSCEDKPLCQRFGDIPRAEAWLIEQYLFTQLQDKRQRIPELESCKARGFQETFKILPGHKRARTLSWLQTEIYRILALGDLGWREMLENLTMDQSNYLLFKKRLADVIGSYRKDLELKLKQAERERIEFENKIVEKAMRQMNAAMQDTEIYSLINYINSD